MRRILAALALAALWMLFAGILSGRIHAQEALAPEVTAALERAILSELELPAVRPDGTHWYVASCRRAHGGCPARARRMARLFVHSGGRWGVNPWTLAAIAMHESGGNPDVVGRHGELGVMQLHPRNRYGRIAARVCAEVPRACAAAIIDGGAQLLASAIRRCGDERGGLSMYNSGSCDRRLVYADRIVARRERMRGGDS